jgi:hypothetical protein
MKKNHFPKSQPECVLHPPSFQDVSKTKMVLACTLLMMISISMIAEQINNHNNILANSKSSIPRSDNKNALQNHSQKYSHEIEDMQYYIANDITNDVCKMAVAKILCADNLGIPRSQMPQLDSELTTQYYKKLKSKGIKVDFSIEKCFNAPQNVLLKRVP